MYRWISDRAPYALFSARSSSGSKRVVSDKESRNSTSSKMVFSESLKSPASANYQVQNQYTVNIMLITFLSVHTKTKKKTSKLYFLLLLKPLIITNQSCKHHLAFKMIKLYIIMSKKIAIQNTKFIAMQNTKFTGEKIGLTLEYDSRILRTSLRASEA